MKTYQLNYIEVENDAVFSFYSKNLEDIQNLFSALESTCLFYGFVMIEHTEGSNEKICTRL